MEIPTKINTKLTDKGFTLEALPTDRDTPDWETLKKECELTTPELFILKNIVIAKQPGGDYTVMDMYIEVALITYKIAVLDTYIAAVMDTYIVAVMNTCIVAVMNTYIVAVMNTCIVAVMIIHI